MQSAYAAGVSRNKPRGRSRRVWWIHRLLRRLLLAATVPALTASGPFEKRAENLAPVPHDILTVQTKDWLIDNRSFVARVTHRQDVSTLTLENGLVRRTLQLQPNAATVALDNLMTGASLLRAVEPEATVTLNGKKYPIGGLTGQPDRAYLLPDWVKGLTNQPSSFIFERFEVGRPVAPFSWKRSRHSQDLPWPPRGASVALHFNGPDDATRGVHVTIHYELYDGAPMLTKWLSVENRGTAPLTVDRFTVERLAFVEAESAVDERPDGAWRTPNVTVLSDYMFKGMDAVTANQVSSWQPDPAFRSQVSYAHKTPCLLVCEPPIGPGVSLQPQQSLDSFRSHLIVHDSTERERQGLTIRRAHRLLAPWSTENPIMMHVRHAERTAFRKAVDQCAEVGFEMIIYTFGSGLNMESADPAYIEKIREDVAYAHAKGIQVGGYSLFSSRRIDDANDVINPKTGKPGGAIFGNAPCFGSQWGLDYLRHLTNFMAQTGMDLLEHDGPYPGDICASTSHPGHKGEADSQWVNWQMSTHLYEWCRERGIYINQPDYYFFAGGNKTAMGYREDNWSLPREQQLIHARQNIFDGTWNKPQSAGWMFVPLTEYHGGGAAATIEPLKDHLDAYEGHLANTLGAGVQACWRGPRLFDADTTRDLVKRYVTWYKQYRDILESDVIHCRRADGRDVDYMVHVNPSLKTRALSMIHNPLSTPVDRVLPFPLYYAGLEGKAWVRRADGRREKVPLDATGRALVRVSIPPKSRTWIAFEATR